QTSKSVVANSSQEEERDMNLRESDFSDSENSEKNESMSSESSENSSASEVESMSVSSDDDSVIHTRSRREVKTIDYSDEHYYESRGVSESSKRKNMNPSDGEGKRKRNKKLKTTDFAISRSATEDSQSDHVKTRSKSGSSKRRVYVDESEEETEDESEDDDYASGRRSQRLRMAANNQGRFNSTKDSYSKIRQKIHFSSHVMSRVDTIKCKACQSSIGSCIVCKLGITPPNYNQEISKSQDVNLQKSESSPNAMEILPTESNESQINSKGNDSGESNTNLGNDDNHIEAQESLKNGGDNIESRENSKNGDDNIESLESSSKNGGGNFESQESSSKNGGGNFESQERSINKDNKEFRGDAKNRDVNGIQENIKNRDNGESQESSKNGDKVGNVTPFRSKLIANPIVNIDKLLFRCTRCHLAAHRQCIPPLYDEQDLNEKMVYYRSKWTCHFCHKWEYNIDKILTFRRIPTEDDGDNTLSMEIDDNPIPFEESDEFFETEYLVKFEDTSYRNVEWVPGPWLMGVAPGKFRNFIKSDPEQLPVEVVIHSDWTKVDRVLDVEYEDGKTLRDLLNNMNSKKKTKKSSGKTKIKTNWEDISDLENTKFKNALQIRINAYNIEPVDDDDRDTVFVEIKKQPKCLENPKRTREPFSKENPNPKYDNILKEYQLDGFK
ncbi:11841_t:CDS:2, partial [Acaulospora colombiana]